MDEGLEVPHLSGQLEEPLCAHHIQLQGMSKECRGNKQKAFHWEERIKAELYPNLTTERKVRESRGTVEKKVSPKCKCETSFESSAVGFAVLDTECLSNIFTQFEGSQL